MNNLLHFPLSTTNKDSHMSTFGVPHTFTS